MSGPDTPVGMQQDQEQEKQQGGRKKNSWLAHVKATMRGHRNKSFKQVLKIAKKTYKRKSRSNRHSKSKHHRRSRQNGGNYQNNEQQQQQEQQKQQQQNGGSGVGGGNPVKSSVADQATELTM
jgi:hypothetical protein